MVLHSVVTNRRISEQVVCFEDIIHNSAMYNNIIDNHYNLQQRNTVIVVSTAELSVTIIY